MSVALPSSIPPNHIPSTELLPGFPFGDPWHPRYVKPAGSSVHVVPHGVGRDVEADPAGLDNRTLKDSDDETVRYLCFRDYGHGLMECGWSRHRKREGLKHVERGTGDEMERHRRSIARAKREVMRKCLNGGLDHLVTVTYRRSETSLSQMWLDITKFADEVRRVLPDWQYIGTWEIQEERAKRTGERVWHAHFGVKGFQNIPLLQAAWIRVVGPGMGNVDVRFPGVKRGEKRRGARFGRLALAKYLAKYIGKNLEDSPLNKKRYWHSDGVESPEVERIPITGSMSGMISWATDLFKASHARVVRVWEHETGLYGYVSSF